MSQNVVKPIRAFTTIEMVVTIIILAIVAVTVVPKWFSGSGYEERTYQDEIVTTLRAVQIRAMQQSNACHKVKVTTQMIGLLKTDMTSADSCHLNQWQDSVRYNLNNEDGPTSVQIDGNHLVTFSGDDIAFSKMGRPEGCTAPCKITITGEEQTLNVFVNAEGFIYEG
ncbi:pilus assembly FimT family protein [Thalassotalea sediminis]|uniref:pilus assembly FimT family protein n=1 Tax=Thalassotalea sediminis TaxID=1759089 RepID=UPI0025745156|nr:type II secretion system protein [Thalassotalea sediminis]